jgi:hypothetical protein
MAVSSSLFFVLSLSETDARVVEAIEAVFEAAELAAFAFAAAAAASRDLAFSINSLLRFRNFSSALSNSFSPELPKMTLESLSVKKRVDYRQLAFYFFSKITCLMI